MLRQVGEKFRNRSLKFPGLISGCTMDWFQRWPKDALIAVSSHFLGQYQIVSEDETKRQLIEMMGTVHDGVAENCATYFQRSECPNALVLVVLVTWECVKHHSGVCLCLYVSLHMETKRQLIEMMGTVHDGVAVNCTTYFQRLEFTRFFMLAIVERLNHRSVVCPSVCQSLRPCLCPAAAPQYRSSNSSTAASVRFGLAGIFVHWAFLYTSFEFVIDSLSS